MSVQLRVLGSAEVRLSNGEPVSLPLGKPLGVLVFVALNLQPQSREAVASLFWPASPRKRALHSLRQALWVLKTSIGEDLFQDGEILGLRPGAVESDVQAIRDALEAGRVDQARNLWRGTFLEGFVIPSSRGWANWVEDVRSDLERRLQGGLLDRARALRGDRSPEEALTYLSEAVELNPGSLTAQETRIELLLELLRLGEARQALAQAWSAVGDSHEVAERLRDLERRLDAIARERRREKEGERPEELTLEFVGRSRELALLRSGYEEALDGRPRVMVVTGPAGIGKTRLAQEFLQGIAGEDSLRVAVKGSRAEMRLRWGGVARLVRQTLLLPGSAGISSASDSLLRAMIPSLGRGTVNLETVNGVSPVALLDAVRDLLEAVSFEETLVVHLDDFQWFDGESQNLLMSLLARPGSLRALFVVSGRADLSSSNWKSLHSRLVQDTGAASFTLAPLSLEEVRELLALMSDFSDPDGAEEVIRRLHKASGGNPLFLRGLLQQLHDQGIIRRSGEDWLFHNDVFPLRFSFPDDIRDLLAERLDQLSPRGALLAGTLARHGGPLRPERLTGSQAGSPEDTTSAVAELLEREIIQWVGEEELDFRHDLLREAALEHLPLAELTGDSSSARSGFWRRGALAFVAAAVVLAIPLGILWGRGGLGMGMEPDPPPFGGGTLIYTRSQEPPLAYEVTTGEPSEWTGYTLQGAPEEPIAGVRRNPDGSLTWYGVTNLPDGPDMTEMRSDGSVRALFPSDGDQGLEDVSPDGGKLLFRSQDMTFDGFSQDLVWGDPESEVIHLLQRAGGGVVGSSRWSPDGDLVAFVVKDAVDTLAIVNQVGDRIGARALGEVWFVDWCGRDVVAVALPGDDVALLRIQVPEMAVDTVKLLDAWTRPLCSPDGRALVYKTVSGTRMPLVLHDLSTGLIQALPDAPSTFSRAFWVPPHPLPVPLGIEASADTMRLAWGERRSLSAVVERSDGSLSEDGIRWESLDPGVATVTQEGELSANGVGATEILARWGYSYLDTVRVEVEDQGSGGALFRDRFVRLDTARWISFGDPVPRADRFRGEPVLRLAGDEKYSEGILFRPELNLERGFTLELEFRMAPSRDVHQNFHLCLADLDREAMDRDLGRFPRVYQEACFHYPSREFEKMDPAEASFLVGDGAEERVRLPGVLPPMDWTHVAIQVRADGQVGLVVDRKVVAVSPLRLRIRPDRSWTVTVQGDAVGTDLLARNLTIWRELRYGRPADR